MRRAWRTGWRRERPLAWERPPVPREERLEGWIIHEPRVDRSTSPFVREVSREDRLMDPPLDVGQPHVSSGVSKGQPLVIEPEQVQDRGVQVVDVHRVLDGLVTEVVGPAVGDARLHAPTGQPEREPLVVMVAAVGVLAVWRAAELAAPDH